MFCQRDLGAFFIIQYYQTPYILTKALSLDAEVIKDLKNFMESLITLLPLNLTNR